MNEFNDMTDWTDSGESTETYRFISSREELETAIKNSLELKNTEATRELVRFNSSVGRHVLRYRLAEIGGCIPIIEFVNGTRPGVALKAVCSIRKNGRVFGLAQLAEHRIIHRTGPLVERYVASVPSLVFSAVEFFTSGRHMEIIKSASNTMISSRALLKDLDRGRDGCLRLGKGVSDYMKDYVRFNAEPQCSVWRLYETLNKAIYRSSKSEQVIFDFNMKILPKLNKLAELSKAMETAHAG
jgi:hypothetical protein